MQHKTIHKGVYVVIDPGMEQQSILSQLEKVKKKPLAAIQIWNNPNTKITSHLIESILALFKDTNTPVLINNEWAYLKEFDLDGVHFDIGRASCRERVELVVMTACIKKQAP